MTTISECDDEREVAEFSSVRVSGNVVSLSVLLDWVRLGSPGGPGGPPRPGPPRDGEFDEPCEGAEGGDGRGIEGIESLPGVV